VALFGPYKAMVRRVVDGDTFMLDIDLGFDHMISAADWAGNPRLACRVFGINAPEKSTKAGKVALEFAAKTLPIGSPCQVLSHGWDKYGGRFNGTITCPDGRDFAAVMLSTGHAVALTEYKMKAARAHRLKKG